MSDSELLLMRCAPAGSAASASAAATVAVETIFLNTRPPGHRIRRRNATVGGISGAALFRAATSELSACADAASAIHSSRLIRLAVTAIGQMSVLFVIRTGRLASL